jgi:hypothetical protein
MKMSLTKKALRCCCLKLSADRYSLVKMFLGAKVTDKCLVAQVRKFNNDDDDDGKGNVFKRKMVSWMTLECFQWAYGMLDDDGMFPG